MDIRDALFWIFNKDLGYWIYIIRRRRELGSQLGFWICWLNSVTRHDTGLISVCTFATHSPYCSAVEKFISFQRHCLPHTNLLLHCPHLLLPIGPTPASSMDFTPVKMVYCLLCQTLTSHGQLALFPSFNLHLLPSLFTINHLNLACGALHTFESRFQINHYKMCFKYRYPEPTWMIDIDADLGIFF